MHRKRKPSSVGFDNCRGLTVCVLPADSYCKTEDQSNHVISATGRASTRRSSRGTLMALPTKRRIVQKWRSEVQTLNNDGWMINELRDSSPNQAEKNGRGGGKGCYCVHFARASFQHQKPQLVSFARLEQEKTKSHRHCNAWQPTNDYCCSVAETIHGGDAEKKRGQTDSHAD